ncbi:hypothetical protein BJX99DRAFT_270082 [Aspergillus californicus]
MSQKIVIIGAGFAGVWSALSAKRLLNLAENGNDVGITVIAPEPALTMRPRLYESNAATLSHPLEALFKAAGVQFLRGLAESIDTKEHTVQVQSATRQHTAVPYNRLILAAGSSLVQPTGVTGLQEHAFDIDCLKSAIKLETHLKSLPSLPSTAGRDTVVVCGAGFTGIEIATELPKRLSHVASPRIILVGNSEEVAPEFGSDTRQIIKEALANLGVEVKVGSAVSAVDEAGVTLASGERIETKTVIWTAGVRATPLTQQIPAPKDNLSRLYVDEYLRVSSTEPDLTDVIATGDAACALADGKENYALMSCQHANHLGRVSGYNAAAGVLGQPLLPYAQAVYNCCLDLGSWGAMVAGGWERKDVLLSGEKAKRTKTYINQTLIYPPVDVGEALESANPMTYTTDRLFEQLSKIVE